MKKSVFFLHSIYVLRMQPHYGPGFDSASDSNEYQESSWGLKGGRPAGKAYNLTAICEQFV
jgi:hypothetical protein